MSKTYIVLVGLAACASGEPVSQVARATLAVAPTSAIVSQFPSRRSVPELPRARALPARALGDNPLTARLEVCVSPHGDTASVRLQGSSGDRVFDDAIVDDVAAWRYAPFAAPANAIACEHTTVTFVP